MYRNRITNVTAPAGGTQPTAWVANPWSKDNPQLAAVGDRALYETAWQVARRDHELDKLFNGPYFYDI